VIQKTQFSKKRQIKVRLYSNLHHDLFNKERKQKEEGDERRRRTNLAIIIRSQQEFLGEKNQKKAKIGCHNVWRRHPCSVLPGSRALKRGESQNGDALN
jgi:hypothetical protein